VAHADPASDLPTVLLALNAKFHISKGRATRVVLANKFFIGLYETALKEDELLVGIEVEAEARGTGSAYAKLENPASRYAMVGAAASVTIVNGVCTAASVAVGGLTTHAWRSKRVPSALLETALDAESISKAAKKVMKELPDDLLGDMHASADYRRAMSQVFVERALTAAAARAKK
jgi:carbon-monoxide dehydrogenase medium subunit